MIKIDALQLSFPSMNLFKSNEEEWQQIDRQLPSLACKYPVSSREATRILSVPKVDDEILEFISHATPPAVFGQLLLSPVIKSWT